MKQSKRKIIAINFGGIGDEVLFFPTLKTIKNYYPQSSVTLVTESRSKSAKSLSKHIDEIITCDIKSKNKYLNIFKFLITVWSKNFDIAISSGSSKMVAILLFLTGIKKRYGYYSGWLSNLLLTDSVELNQEQYAADMYHDLTKYIDSEARSSLPEVDLDGDDLRWANEQIGDRSRKVVLIHPGVSKMSINKQIYKSWQAKNWTALLERLLESNNYKVILAGGPDDEHVMQEIQANLATKDYNEDNIVDLFGKTKNISQLAALIKMSDVMVCVDSAPMHISVGVRTNTVALFGPTNEKKLLPSNDERFVAIKNENIDCRPCLWHKRQYSCSRRYCLNIKPDDVFEAVEKFCT